MAGPKTAQLELPLESRRSEALSRAHICLAGKLVTYEVKRSRRRHSITLTIDERGLRVGAPWQVTGRAIENLLQKHDEWVLGKLEEWQRRRPPPRSWQEGERIMWLGQPLRLAFLDDAGEIRVDGERLVVGHPALRPDSTARRVIEWLRLQALQCFRERTALFCPMLEVPEPEIRLSNARTRWGSCHVDGHIHLNWRLIQMPLRLIDYVVAHELAHLVEMNHSSRFWKTVARIVPDYAARKTEIRRGSHGYLLL